MTIPVLVAALLLACACAAEPRHQQGTPRARSWRHLDARPNTHFVGPHVCRSRNSTHCCPGWTSRPNSLLCVVPLCRPDCGSPGACVAPNMCRCPGGIEAPSCGPGGGGGGGLYPYPARTRGGCRRICMNGGTCADGTCACAPGWSGEFCTEPICREPCLHGGRCIAPDRCVCFHGLSGTRCEIDRRTGPCYTDTRGALCTGALEGVVCTKQLCCATVGVAWGHPCERCGDLDCPPGHLRNLHTKQCQDIDECAAVPGLCEGGKCVNSAGSFSCECPPGQRRHPTSNNCEDIDECEDPDICPNGKCVNTEGDYYCLCNPHFIPSPDKKFCIDGRVGSCYTYLSETGECSDKLAMPLSNRDCCCGYNMGRAWGDMCAPCPPRHSLEWTHLCGGGASSIPPYWKRNDSSSGGDEDRDHELEIPTNIVKINECMLRSGICGLGDCVDKEDGYSCNCWEGAEQTEPDGHPTCIDVDECTLGYCQGGQCLNTPGSFECRCPPGFDPVENGLRCSDKNECEMTRGGMCTNGECRELPNGRYECVCNSGYEKTESGAACRDVDECAANPGVCRRGRCRNTAGGYECRCEPGFAPSAAGYCADVDECGDATLCQGGRCVNVEGSYQCVCEAGYRATPDRGACVDVDECAEPRVCRNGRCHNTPGSFRCDCEEGFSLSATGRTCIDEVQDLCYEKYEEGHCSGPGASPITRSQCCCGASKGLSLGWGRACKPCPEPDSREYKLLCPEFGKDNGGVDINECTMTPGACAHGACENLEPGYRCLCDPGYYPDEDNVCRDIDECDMHQSYCAGGQCRNTAGSFACACPAGTRHDPEAQLCVDIDECDGERRTLAYVPEDYPRGDIPPTFLTELANPCDNGRCINTHGSYECECEHGFVLDPTAQHCIDNRRGSCWRRVVDGACEAAAPRTLLRQECCCSVGLAWGSPCAPCDPAHCPCPKGFAKLDGATCRDIDECRLDAELCAGGECVNTDGSYRCRCPPHLQLDDTGHRCVDTRVETCYTEYAGGRCSGALPAAHRAVCCCSALGRAWGDARCEPCPKRGTESYRQLCSLATVFPKDPTNPDSPTILPPGIGPGVITPGGGITPGYLNESGMFPLDSRLNGSDGGLKVDAGWMDVNECAAFPGLCGHGRCRNVPGGFTCDCFPGYEPDSKNRTCVDINECEVVMDVCGAGECRNTPGGFSCHCEPGHRSDKVARVCVDIDECTETPGLCRGGRCVNTAGSFQCVCAPGMELSPDRLGCKDVDECSLTSGICSNGACENLMGTYQCVCDEGYAQSSVKSHCEDIDECSEDPGRCQHDCVNTPGSYHCTCREGWHLRADGRSCRDVDECAGGARPCGGGACRNTPGSYHCSCGEGLLPSPEGAKPTCLDIDECADVPDLCGAGSCHNTIGSFVCRCPDGYSVKPELGPACSDDDECALGTCDCHPAADCINLPGSFQCRCRDGWRGDGAECEDVDECLTNNGGCHPRATCRNTDGSFMCLCDTGYKGDGYSCVDIDECANDPTLCENGHCGNTAGGYECDCDVGFTRAPDGRSCLDMDECATFDNVCVFGRCVNTYGMFKCICDRGYQSDSVDDLMPGFNCTDVDECKSPQSCQYGQCVNTQGSYVCRCPPNYDLVSDGTACYDSRKARCYSKVELRSGTELCRDSDELSEDGTMAACCCSVGVAWGNYCDMCPEPGSEAYRQLCPGGPGYQPVLEPPSYVVSLADIDECAAHPALCAHGACTNTFGSFVCACAAGWRLADDGRRCEDIDECEEEGKCGPGVCRNLPGSYVCLCPEGYVAMPDGKECVDVRQRQCYLEWEAEGARCRNAVGVPQTKYLCCCSVGRAWGAPCEACPARGSAAHARLCGERPGEYKNPVTNETAPIDECDLMPQLCRPGACRDTPTGFQCECDHGYEHDQISHVCRDVDECAAGGGPGPCRGLARCVNLPGGYECRCPAGYALAPARDSCEDVDECQDPASCAHGECTNTIGSYRCECKPGYTLKDNTCRDVDECARPRPLCRNGTCENLPGSYLCHCDPGFKPTHSNECVDINECREGGMVCRNGRCRNTVGSFRCECSSGYVLTPDGRNCRDVDECTEHTHPCGRDGNPSCTNTNGGYECACGAGWRLAGKRCVDKDECRDAPHACAGGQCRNFDGGFVCECPEGWRFDQAAAVCVDERRELCYEQWQAGRCHLPRPLQLSRTQCCCSDGAAWGRYCERCPAPGSPQFEDVCAGGRGRQNLTHDLDECVIRPNICRGGVCVNTDGSFRCQCPGGYALDESGLACADVDECAADPRVCGNGTCGNTPGGYECRCSPGFTQGGDGTCVDIDECAEGRAQCSFRCHNTAGSFRCTCPNGYRVAADGVHCRDIDECADNPCPHACENLVGSYMCKCDEGYRRSDAAADSRDACEDIDECAEQPDVCAPGVCVNEPGGYSCDCDDGWEPSDDQRQCIDRRTGSCYRSLAAPRCVPAARRAANATGSGGGGSGGAVIPGQLTKAQCCCTLGVAWGPECEVCPQPGTVDRAELCSPVNLLPPGTHGGIDGTGGSGGIGGIGENGIIGENFGEIGDIDECAAMPDLCAPGRCVNTIGSFRCVCGRGYRAAGGACADVDECAARPPRPAPCPQLCTNTEGSYTCSCRAGWELDEDGAECRDVDECALGSHTCQQLCTNTAGSYECSCEPGYERRGDACVDINECLEEGVCGLAGSCVNLLGSFRCVCPRGLRLDAAGRCVERTECELSGHCLPPCRNYANGRSCDCPPGTARSSNGACMPEDACAAAPCGGAPCFPVAGAFRCGCPAGYGWDSGHAVCLQLAGGCATANCLFGCQPAGTSFECGCPGGYQLVGAGHCVTALESSLTGDDIGGVPVFPVKDQYKLGDDLISTEGCFSCKVNGRRRRAPEEGIVYANGTTLVRKRRRRTRTRRSALQPEAELVTVRGAPAQSWGRAPLLRLTPARAGLRAHYRVAYGDPGNDFVLSKRDGAWALRLRRHLSPQATFERQLELEARFVQEGDARSRRWRRRRSPAPAPPPPLRLYVNVRLEPTAGKASAGR